MLFSLKYIRPGYIVGIVLSFVLGVLIGLRSITTVVYPISANDVVITVAHLTVQNPNFELLASFPDEDVAYYRQVDKVKLVSVGDEVCTYRGDTAIVIDVSIHGFTLQCDYLLIGDSGTVIRNSNNAQVGYVSQQVGDNLFYCIWS